MAKSSGATGYQRLFVDGYDVSGNVSALTSVNAMRDNLDVTDITQTGKDRRGGLVSGELTVNGWWDATVGANPPAVHDVFKTLRDSANFQYFTDNSAVGTPVAGLIAHQASYNPVRSDDGALAWTISAQSHGAGLEWGFSLTTGAQTFASQAYGTDCDDLAGSPTSTAFGAILYVHLFSLGSGSVTISAVEGASANPTTAIAGCTTGSINTRGAYRLPSTSTTATIRRYTRIYCSGTFTNAVVAAMLVRPIAAQG